MCVLFGLIQCSWSLIYTTYILARPDFGASAETLEEFQSVFTSQGASVEELTDMCEGYMNEIMC